MILRLAAGAERSAFDRCLEAEHYLASSALVGQPLRYAAELDGRWVALLTFSLILQGLYCRGNAPTGPSSTFYGDEHATVYYLSGTTGWGENFGERPTALWRPQILTNDGHFGVRTNRFGFMLSWACGMTVVVDAASDFANPFWTPVETNTLATDTVYFSDPDWAAHASRFYRARMP